jgi:predicted site-specific integrase-resolvase
MKQLVSISKASDMLGVCPETLRYWELDGKISPIYTSGGHRRYKVSELEEARNEYTASSDITKVAVYCRTSSHEQKQKGDLERQKGRVLQYCVDKQYHVVETFEEVGSGMSDSRAKLKKLFKLIEEGKVQKVIVEHKDRLCRFMFEFLVCYFASHNVEIEWVSDVLGKSYEEELVEDILSLMASFSNRIYGKRSAENRKARKLAEEAKILSNCV